MRADTCFSSFLRCESIQEKQQLCFFCFFLLGGCQQPHSLLPAFFFFPPGVVQSLVVCQNVRINRDLSSPQPGQVFIYPSVTKRYQNVALTSSRGQTPAFFFFFWRQSIGKGEKKYSRVILSFRDIKAVCVRARHLVDSVIITWKIIKQYLRALFKTKNSHGCASIKRIPFRFYTYSPQFRQIALFAWLCVAESDYKVAREPGEQRMFTL